MNDLSETITSFLTIRDILRDSNGDKQLVDAAVVLFEHYIDVQDRAFVKAWNTVIREPNQYKYTDDELDAMCDAAELEQTQKNYRAAIDEYNKLQDKYNDLKIEHEALQCLFVQEEYDHDELKVEYDKVQKDYHTVVTNVMNSK
jgi:hypothetical protein